MPEERKDTKPTAQEEDAKLPSIGREDSGDVPAAADQLAAVNLVDKDEAGTGTGTSETQHVDECYGPLSDPDLWKAHPPTEDCPVCLIPLPLDSYTTYMACCGKMICSACLHEHYRALEITNRKRRKKELSPLDRSCALCRESTNKNDAEYAEQIKKRIDKGDAEAMITKAHWCRDGLRGLPKDEAKFLELMKKAADIGSGEAMYYLGFAYIMGVDGAPKDEKKGISHLETAVKMGNVDSRCLLGSVSAAKGNFHLANKHYRLAAEAGQKTAIKQIWTLFSHGNVSKTDLEEILRAHQSICDEMDSEDRQRYDALKEAMAGNDEVLKDLYGAYYLGWFGAKQLKEALKMHRNGKVQEISNFLANAMNKNST